MIATENLFFKRENRQNKKKRYVVVVDQRDDNCLAVCRISSYSKEKSKSYHYYHFVILNTRNTFGVLNKQSLVERKIWTRVKKENDYKIMTPEVVEDTGYKISLFEYLIIMIQTMFNKEQRRILREWKRHYKK